MIAFVLSGGGSRGALQVGALHALLEAGIQPDMLIGTSVGAVNASFIAAEPNVAGIEKLEAMWLQLNDATVFPGNKGAALLRFIRGKPSLYPNDEMHTHLMHYLEHKHFSELSLPCYAVAVDVDSGEIVVFGDKKEDTLEDGLMSTMALAPAHPPWLVGERRFIDGCFGAILPVRQAIERGATQIIALNLRKLLLSGEQVQSAFEMMTQTTDLLVRQQVKNDLAYASQHADVTVIDLYSDLNVPIDDFSCTEERIVKGREITTAILTEPKVAARLGGETNKAHSLVP